MKNYLYVDTETTGLDPLTDEIVSVSVLDNENKCLYHSLLKPIHKTEWHEAMKINKITPEMVKHAPTFDMVKDHLRDIFSDQCIVFYNKVFDKAFLKDTLTTAKELSCCMVRYAEYVNGEWDAEANCYKRISLVEAVKNVAPNFHYQAHDSLEDCKATREVWQFLEKQQKQQ